MTAPHRSSTGSPRKVRTIDPDRAPRPAREPSDLAHLIDGPIEAMLIGTILSDGESAYRQVRFLSPEDFGLERHRIAWREITALADEVHPTLDEIYHRVSSSGRLDSVGGLEYLLELHRHAIPGSPLEGFARTIRAKSIQRHVWTLN